jgi:ClpP class serine protease
MQSQGDETYHKFVKHVARNRDVRPSTVASRAWGEGRHLGAAAPKKAGLVDGVSTISDLLGDLRLGSGRLARSGRVGVNREMKAWRFLHEMSKLESLWLQMG